MTASPLRSICSLLLSAAAVMAVPLVARAADSGYLGIGFSVDPDSGVLKVEQVVPGSPAEQAGVEVADEVLKVGQIELAFPRTGPHSNSLPKRRE